MCLACVSTSSPALSVGLFLLLLLLLLFFSLSLGLCSDPPFSIAEYTKNQQVLYVSKLKPKTPLNAVFSFASAGAQVSNVKWTSAFSCASAGSGSGNCHVLGREPCFQEDTCGPCRFGLKDTNPAGGASNEASCVIHAATADAAVTWDDMRGIKVNGTNLSPVGAVGWGYSGAVSQHSFADCDESGGVAGIRFKAGSPDGYAMIGLNHAADINNYAHYAGSGR
jgi:hypothetical protein